MWPLLIAAGAIALLVKAFSDDSSEEGESPKKIFISFAMKDKKYRDFLVAQSKNDRSPFEFVDMSVKQPWDEEVWKEKCRSKIKMCDGIIVLLSKNTWNSGGARWEIKCAKEERIKIVGMHIKKDDRGAIPTELRGKKVITWEWNKLKQSIESI